MKRAVPKQDWLGKTSFKIAARCLLVIVSSWKYYFYFFHQCPSLSIKPVRPIIGTTVWHLFTYQLGLWYHAFGHHSCDHNVFNLNWLESATWFYGQHRFGMTWCIVCTFSLKEISARLFLLCQIPGFM